MKVLIIPEDFRNDRYVLKPLFKRLFRDIGKPHANIEVCQDPLLGGVGEALKPQRIQEIVDQYDWVTDIIFILCIDRDGDQGRRAQLDDIETKFGNGRVFLAENAWEESETWVLAGLGLPKGWRWSDVRAEIHVKERYFEPLARKRGVAASLGGGRKALGEEASRSIGAIRQKCPEDFDALARRVEAAVRVQ